MSGLVNFKSEHDLPKATKHSYWNDSGSVAILLFCFQFIYLFIPICLHFPFSFLSLLPLANILVCFMYCILFVHLLKYIFCCVLAFIFELCKCYRFYTGFFSEPCCCCFLLMPFYWTGSNPGFLVAFSCCVFFFLFNWDRIHIL